MLTFIFAVAKKTQRDFDIAMKGGTLMIRNGSMFFLGSGGSGNSCSSSGKPSICKATLTLPCAKRTVRTIAQCKVGVEDVHFVRIQDDHYSDMLSTTAKQLQPQESTIAHTTTQSRQQGETPELTTASSQVSSSEFTEETDSHTTKQEDPDFSPVRKRRKLQSYHSGFDRELLRRM